jgi:hypothetical protein
VVLSSSRRYSTCQFANADKDGKITEPDEYKAINETSRSATKAVNQVRLVGVQLSLTFGNRL